jgi:PBP1b-binding outer membrane lipoprotein LpoB
MKFFLRCVLVAVFLSGCSESKRERQANESASPPAPASATGGLPSQDVPLGEGNAGARQPAKQQPEKE